MNRFRLFVLHKLERRQTLGGKPDDSRTANEMTRSIRRVARRFGVVLGVRSRAGDDTLVVCAEQTTLDGKPRRPKKTVRFDIKPEPSSKRLKRTLKKACQYVSLGAMASAPGVLMHPTEPNLATHHRSSWSPWNDTATWSHSAQLFL